MDETSIELDTSLSPPVEASSGPIYPNQTFPNRATFKHAVDEVCREQNRSCKLTTKGYEGKYLSHSSNIVAVCPAKEKGESNCNFHVIGHISRSKRDCGVVSVVACHLQHAEDCTTTRKRHSTREIFNHEELRQIARVAEHDKDLQQRAKELFNIDLSQSTANRLRNAVRPKPTEDVQDEGATAEGTTKEATNSGVLLSDSCDLASLDTSVLIATAPVKKARLNKNRKTPPIATDALASTITSSAVTLPSSIDLSAFVYTEQV